MILAVLGVLLTYATDIRACQRSSVNRRESNLQGTALKSVLLKAADAREKSAVAERAEGKLLLAEIDEQAAADFRSSAKLIRPLEVPDCFPFPGT